MWTMMERMTILMAQPNQLSNARFPTFLHIVSEYVPTETKTTTGFETNLFTLRNRAN